MKKNFFKLVDETTYIKRYNICLECNELKFGICTQCKCVMKLKTKLTNATCPLNKWNTYFSEEWL